MARKHHEVCRAERQAEPTAPHQPRRGSAGPRWRRRLLVGEVLLLLALVGCRPTPEASEDVGPPDAASAAPSDAVSGTAEAAIGALLDAQVEDWNTGDLRGFMAGYWNSPELRFASDDTVRRGWQPVLDRYLASYPDRSAMGTLAFVDREVDVLAADAALVFGRWRLERAGDRPEGLYTLLLRRFPDLVVADEAAGYGAAGWRIVADHTSAGEVAEDEPPGEEDVPGAP